MVTCTTAMVECLVDANKTEQVISSNIGVKVLTSVSRVNISFAKTEEIDANETEGKVGAAKVKPNTRLHSKSFRNITMNNTIGLSVGKNLLRNIQAVSFNEGIMKKGLETTTIPFTSRKMISQTPANNTVVEELNKVATCVDIVAPESENTKEVFRKVKLHSDSEGFRSPLKQINNQLTTKQCQRNNIAGP